MKRKRNKPRDLCADWVSDDDWSLDEKPSKPAKKAAAAPKALERIDLAKMNAAALQKYRALFRLPGGASNDRAELLATVSAHFFKQQVDEDETLLRFVVALRRASPKGLHIPRVPPQPSAVP